ncbi:hypothetical protein EV10_0270 [Prochlorococcus marinus str. SS51]|uniref:Uncharacterized conserved membrane protein n=2 Tax=Prochlorococcaceae TaxID=2881426 RepID=Q7VD96_PROMA|nr:Uncharacterized conserved membrane protein [Prochlorococcus marinus subsp. marinus str. CCMP1375]KGG11195.1 hypothetical protein EV04_1270 [Prochlorococcus marinus str. LG]KGG21533.1 hypothetical protein EV08_0620 [Prochlorococcus marinus str. SS2]KGG23123.1 hypothetical protein EV09_1869 [Prochlorococcus marinus str. SS35]KGG33833.1 hypothetical protein EV10_0270 [Prochlorococcus marinus str. SS51]
MRSILFKKLLLTIFSIFRSTTFKGWIKLLLTSLSFGFVAITIFKNFEKITQESLPKESIVLLIIGFSFSVLSLIVNSLAWSSLLTWLGFNQKNMKIEKLFLKTNLLKYLPGGIWHFLERFRVLTTYISPTQAFSSVLLEPFLMLSASLFLVPIAGLKNIMYVAFFIPSFLLARRWRGSLLMQLGASKLLDFKKLGAKFSFNRNEIQSSEPISPYPILAFLIEILFVFLRFASFWLCLKAFSIETYLPIVNWISLFSFAWSVGLIVPSAPGGAGIFESFILLFAREPIPQESLILVLLSYRLLVSLADILIALIFSFKKLKKLRLIV